MMQGLVGKLNKRNSHIAAFRCYADDVGAALASFKLLALVVPVFDHGELFAGLSLKCSKCVLVPTSFRDFKEVQAAIQDWLGKHTPKWANFKVQTAHTYLGASLEPGSGSLVWPTAVAKYWHRVAVIARAGLSPYFSALAYNTYAVPVLDYL